LIIGIGVCLGPDGEPPSDEEDAEGEAKVDLEDNHRPDRVGTILALEVIVLNLEKKVMEKRGEGKGGEGGARTVRYLLGVVELLHGLLEALGVVLRKALKVELGTIPIKWKDFETGYQTTSKIKFAPASKTEVEDEDEGVEPVVIVHQRDEAQRERRVHQLSSYKLGNKISGMN